MSFANNGDGTITDNVTSLMWQMAPDGQAYNWYEATGTFDAVNNPTAFNVCSDLTLGGHTDWRLPDIKELATIADAAASLVMPSSALYCSATTIVDETDSVWVMMFSPTNPSYVKGEIFRFGAGNSKYFCGSFYSRCVR